MSKGNTNSKSKRTHFLPALNRLVEGPQLPGHTEISQDALSVRLSVLLSTSLALQDANRTKLVCVGHLHMWSRPNKFHVSQGTLTNPTPSFKL